MAEETEIAWTDHTFNPWIGCTKISPGCDHCYAESIDKRTGRSNWGPGAPRTRTRPDYWLQALKWDREAAQAGRRDRVFCASLADIFDKEVDDTGWRNEMWQLILHTPHLDWQILTKRPQLIRARLPENWGDEGYPNVWLGTSVENQKFADTRIKYLVEIPARVRFLSCEPLLGPLDLTRWLGADKINWVIVGGESGGGSRPMHPIWPRQIRDQCAAAQVPYFFKQWGQFAPVVDIRPAMRRINSTKGAGFVLDGQTHREFPVMVNHHVAPIPAKSDAERARRYRTAQSSKGLRPGDLDFADAIARMLRLHAKGDEERLHALARAIDRCLRVEESNAPVIERDEAPVPEESSAEQEAG